MWRENFVFEHTKNRLSTKKGSETEEGLHNNKKNHYDYSVLWLSAKGKWLYKNLKTNDCAVFFIALYHAA